MKRKRKWHKRKRPHEWRRYGLQGVPPPKQPFTENFREINSMKDNSKNTPPPGNSTALFHGRLLGIMHQINAANFAIDRAEGNNARIESACYVLTMAACELEEITFNLEGGAV